MKRKAVKRPFEEVSYKDILDKFIENINVGLGGKPVWDEKTRRRQLQSNNNKKKLYFQMQSIIFGKVGAIFFPNTIK